VHSRLNALEVGSCRKGFLGHQAYGRNGRPGGSQFSAGRRFSLGRFPSGLWNNGGGHACRPGAASLAGPYVRDPLAKPRHTKALLPITITTQCQPAVVVRIVILQYSWWHTLLRSAWAWVEISRYPSSPWASKSSKPIQLSNPYLIQPSRYPLAHRRSLTVPISPPA
jgi:hypothetical protein